ncbi:hypothetical protein NPIL_662701 [Nephila pilipes]|uniref:Uncharacterized protein n=1 Tax=Nephila pilipes TaxID=299642 RepID=A0A8X6IY39_NEPPI|nr:hypothetical protein NPIL_662701 [Nephila pilipes]
MHKANSSKQSSSIHIPTRHNLLLNSASFYSTSEPHLRQHLFHCSEEALRKGTTRANPRNNSVNSTNNMLPISSKQPTTVAFQSRLFNLDSMWMRDTISLAEQPNSSFRVMYTRDSSEEIILHYSFLLRKNFSSKAKRVITGCLGTKNFLTLVTTGFTSICFEH